MINEGIIEELKHSYAIDVAKKHNITEGELTNLRLDHDAKILSVKDIKLFIADLESLGKVKCVTRNTNAVSIQEGFLENQYLNGYKEIDISAEAGLILNPRALDLRIFFRHWEHIFYIEQLRHNENQKSFQIFSKNGVAICKIYLTDDSNLQALKIILDKYISKEQASATFENIKPEHTVNRDKTAIQDAEIELAWREMKEVHDFYLLMRKYRLSRQEIFSKVNDDLACKVRTTSLTELLSLAKERKEEVTIFISNIGCVQIFTGTIKSLFDKDNYLNIYSSHTRIHLYKDIAECWIVRKPSECGFVTSLEVFNSKGEQIIQVYGQRNEGQPERETWRSLINEL
jgi:putative hemin transport protein